MSARANYPYVCHFVACCCIITLSILLSRHHVQADNGTVSSSATERLAQIKASECKDLTIESMFVKCAYNTSCVYGEPNTIECHVDDDIPCKGEHKFEVTFPCLYCWQLPEEQLVCSQNNTCRANTRYLATCSTNQTTHCMGHRAFSKYRNCNITRGHKWSMALVLSVLFGGFGVDRFYLGHWQEGVGKLFSFGGFGVWTLIDTILIAIGYLKPAESSRYEL